MTTPTSPPKTSTGTRPDGEVEEKREFSQAKRDKMAKGPKAMNDGSYPIENITDLKNAISAYGRADEEKRPELRKHIVRNAKRLNAENMLPKNWSETPASEKKAVDPFTAGVLLALAGFEDNAADNALALELKAGPPGATFPSKDLGAAKLRRYWTKGPGAAKIRWGQPGDFNRCVMHMRKYVGERAKGLCNIYHRSAIGVAPGQEKSEVDSGETKALWVPDTDAPGGWRAQESAWGLESKEADVAEREPDTRSDDEVMSGLDKYEGMAESVESAYEEAIGNDIPWDLEPNGELSDPESETDDAPSVETSLFDDTEE
jgi:hypothetical protein